MAGALSRIGHVGAFTVAPLLVPPSEGRELAQEIDELGYPALWFGEIGDSFAHAALLLGWTERLVVATGIANIYHRDSSSMVAGGKILGGAFPGRFVLGLGVGHAPLVARRGHTYGRPIEAMNTYLDTMDTARFTGSEPEVPVPHVLAALGPRMLEVARDRTAGAHPYFVPVEHTAFARDILGAGPLLAPEQAVLLETDPAKARQGARSHMELYLTLDNYRNNLLRVGFTDDDLANGGSDRLVDAIVAWGNVDAIRARVQAHLDAGANHVSVQPVGVPPSAAIDMLRELAPALLSL